MAGQEKWYFTRDQLTNSPTRKCGLDGDKELAYRQQSANLIQDMGQRLQVSQLCINTAIVYMHRFYAFHSFSQFHRNTMAAAALFLAAKVEEQPRKLEYVIKVAHACLHRGEGIAPPDTRTEHYQEQAQDLVFNENVLLQTLGFDVAIDHPHTHVVRTCHLVKAPKDLAQTSYFMASNSLHLTTMCLQYRPTVVACFCIHLASKWSNWAIPQSNEGRHWFSYVDRSVTIELLEKLTGEFLHIFDRCPSRLKKKMMSISGNDPGFPVSGPGGVSQPQPSSVVASPFDPKKVRDHHLTDDMATSFDREYEREKRRGTVSGGYVPVAVPAPPAVPPTPKIDIREYREKKEREDRERRHAAARAAQQQGRPHTQQHRPHGPWPQSHVKPTNPTAPHDRHRAQQQLLQSREQAPRDLQSREQILRDGQLREQMLRDPQTREQVSRDPQSREQTTRDPQSREQMLRDPQLREQVLRDPQLREQVLRDQQSREQMSRDPQSREHVLRDLQLREQVPRDPQSREQVPRDPQSREHVPRDPHSREHTPRDPQSREQLTRDPQIREHAPRDPQTREPLLRELQTREQVSREPQTREQISRESQSREQIPRESQSREQVNREQLVTRDFQSRDQVPREQLGARDQVPREQTSREPQVLREQVPQQPPRTRPPSLFSPESTVPSPVPIAHQHSRSRPRPVDTNNAHHQRRPQPSTAQPQTAYSQPNVNMSLNNVMTATSAAHRRRTETLPQPVSPFSSPPPAPAPQRRPEPEISHTSAKKPDDISPADAARDAQRRAAVNARHAHQRRPPSNSHVPTTTTNLPTTNGIETDPAMVSNLLKESLFRGPESLHLNRLEQIPPTSIATANSSIQSATVERISRSQTMQTPVIPHIEPLTTMPVVETMREHVKEPVKIEAAVDSHIIPLQNQEAGASVSNAINLASVGDDEARDRHRSDKKKKKEKHKHKDREKRDERKKRKKDKDKDRKKSSGEEELPPPASALSPIINLPSINPALTAGAAPIRITIPREKLSSSPGLKIKIPKERLASAPVPPPATLPSSPTPISGPLKIKISKDVLENSRKRTSEAPSGPASKAPRHNGGPQQNQHQQRKVPTVAGQPMPAPRPHVHLGNGHSAAK